jgi:hypothetical protein
MFEMTNENIARLLTGLTVAVGNRRNRVLFYQFLAAEIRALHYSYGVGDGESYKRALTFLECERLTLRSLVRKSAERHVEVTIDHAKRVFLRALTKLDGSHDLTRLYSSTSTVDILVFCDLTGTYDSAQHDSARLFGGFSGDSYGNDIIILGLEPSSGT